MKFIAIVKWRKNSSLGCSCVHTQAPTIPQETTIRHSFILYWQLILLISGKPVCLHLPLKSILQVYLKTVIVFRRTSSKLSQRLKVQNSARLALIDRGAEGKVSCHHIKIYFVVKRITNYNILSVCLSVHFVMIGCWQIASYHILTSNPERSNGRD